jgi:hypothetical protein
MNWGSNLHRPRWRRHALKELREPEVADQWLTGPVEEDLRGFRPQSLNRFAGRNAIQEAIASRETCFCFAAQKSGAKPVSSTDTSITGVRMAGSPSNRVEPGSGRIAGWRRGGRSVASLASKWSLLHIIVVMKSVLVATTVPVAFRRPGLSCPRDRRRKDASRTTASSEMVLTGENHCLLLERSREGDGKKDRARGRSRQCDPGAFYSGGQGVFAEKAVWRGTSRRYAEAGSGTADLIEYDFPTFLSLTFSGDRSSRPSDRNPVLSFQIRLA